MEYSNSQEFVQGHYTSIRGVTVELSSKYRCPELISLPYEYVITNDNIIKDNDYDFSKELDYLKEIEKNKKEEEQKKMEELKTKAPGLSDKVLEPIRINQQEQAQKEMDDKETSKQSNICISDFEDVPPLDPWDRSKTDKDELLQLQLEMSEMSCSNPKISNSNANSVIPNNNTKINGSPQLCGSPPSTSNANKEPYSPILNQGTVYNATPPPPNYSYYPYGTNLPVPSGKSDPTPPYNPYSNPPYNSDMSNGYNMPPPLPVRPINPYPNPTNPSDELLESIVNMGFDRNIVLSGIRSYGNDKRKIIDYSINFSYFTSKGYLPKYIDTAISLYDLNRDKCEKFLESFMKLMEMGFDQEEIKEALVFSENDSEAAIDHLTK